MPEVYRNGRNYSAALPNGGLTGQALVKASNGDGDVTWGDAGGAVFCYVVGETPYAADWLSLTPTGTALTPNSKLIYLILTEGQYYHNFVRWDTTESLYLPVSSGGGGVIANATLTASGWNSFTKRQTLTFAGYQSSMGGVIGMPASATAAQKEAYSNAIIDVVAHSGNQFTFECQNIPAINLPVTVYAGGGSGSGGGGGGDATLSEDVTSSIDVGGVQAGDTFPEGTTFTEFVKKLITPSVYPKISVVVTGSGLVEKGSSVLPEVSLNILFRGSGIELTNVVFKLGNDVVNTQAVSSSAQYTYTFTTPITDSNSVFGVLEFNDQAEQTAHAVSKSVSFTFVSPSYYGAVTQAPATKAEVTALTKVLLDDCDFQATFSLNNQKACYCYPAVYGDITNIKDANSFEYINSYTKTTVTIDGVAYNVYTLTDPVTITSFKQIYS